MSRRETTRLARALITSMGDVSGPAARLDMLDRIERDCLPEVHPVIARARAIIRNGR